MEPLIQAFGLVFDPFVLAVIAVSAVFGMFVGAMPGLTATMATALLVRRGAEHDLNLKSAFLHLMGDVLSTVGAVMRTCFSRSRAWTCRIEAVSSSELNGLTRNSRAPASIERRR